MVCIGTVIHAGDWMKSKVCLGIVFAVSLGPQWTSAFGQDIPLSVQVERLKANRSEFPIRDQGANLIDRAVQTNRDVVLNGVGTEQPIGCSTPCKQEEPENNRRIRAAAKSADLIIIGTVLTNLSTLTTNKASILTDSEVKVDELLKGQVDTRALDDGGSLNELTLTHPGGAVRSHGHASIVNDPEFRNLSIGHQYIFFLRYIPQSHSYKQLLGTPGFDISTDTITSNSKLADPENSTLLANKSTWIAALRRSIEHESEGNRQ